MPKIIFEPPTPTVTILPWDGIHSLGVQLGQTAPASTIWGAVNRALYIPFIVYRPVTIYKIFWHNGSVVSGNVDAGVYSQGGVRLASTGSTAQAGVNDYQEVTLGTPLKIGAGYFFLGLAMDNTTGTQLRRQLGNPEGIAAGQYQESSAFPLPAQATFANISSSWTPVVGVRTYV